MEIEIDEQMEFLPDDMVCSVCYAEFLDIEDLQMHVKQLHLNESRKNRFCKICTQIFSDIESYASHIRRDHLNNLKSCKYCTRLFQDTDELVLHEKKHNAVALYPKMSCSHCENVFNNKNELETHESKVHGDLEDGFNLFDCLPILSSLLNMNAKQFFEASYSNVPYVCAVCELTTLDVSMYIQHLADKDCRSLSCNDCYNVYTRKSKLVNHISRHITSNNAQRKAISKSQCHKCQHFLKSRSLQSHLKKCTGMSCRPCNKTFSSVNEYTNHVSEHSKRLLPLEVCIYCQRQMVGAKAMAKHVERAHKNEIHLYKYHCTDCDRLFKHPKFLFAHFFSKHKDLHPYTCKICNKKFRIRKNFTLHIKLDHKSVGSVEFDDNFHVSFTDKKPETLSKCQHVLEEVMNKNEETAQSNVDIKGTDVSVNSENSDLSLGESSEMVLMKKNYEGVVVKTVKKLCKFTAEMRPDDAQGKKFTDKNNTIVKVDVSNAVVNVDNKLDNNETGVEIKEKFVQKRKLNKNIRYTKPNKKSTVELTNVIDLEDSSTDSDAPLDAICKKIKLQRSKHRNVIRTPWNKEIKTPKTQNRKFVCNKCNRNCYTYQNYERHRALHDRRETKICIKCYGKFDSVRALNEHVKLEHSSSKLTETLKKLLEKRKNKPNEPNGEHSKNVTDDTAKRPLTMSEKFRNTVKKVHIEKSKTEVTVKRLDSSQISVKKYIENFMPENNEVKLTVLNHKLTLDTSGVRRRPLIKLTKFTPDPIDYLSSVKLRMPVRFTDDAGEKCVVKVRLVDSPVAPSIQMNQIEEQNVFDEHTDFHEGYGNFDIDIQSKMDAIPEVAQEVLLVGTEAPCKVLHTMSLKNLSARGDIAIAHPSPHAPFYKISKFKGLLDKEGQSFVLNQPPPVEEAPKDITLRNGKKLVNVNPLAHLLDKNAIGEVLKARKHYPYYKPKLKNITEAITKAMEKLDSKPAVKKKT